MTTAKLTLIVLILGTCAVARAQPQPPDAYPAPPVPPPTTSAPPGYQPYPPRVPVPYRPLTPTRESRPSAIYGELLGKGLIYSVGFDYAIRKWIALGASFSYFDSAAFISPYVNFYPVGSYRSSLLLQAGLQLVHINVKNSILDGLPLWDNVEEGLDVGGQVAIGYEFRAGFLFRVSLLGMFNKNGLMPWPGLTFGGSF